MENKEEFLEKLIIIETDIYEAYMAIAELEKANMLSDSSYLEILQILPSLFQDEKDLLESYELSYEDVLQIMLFLLDNEYTSENIFYIEERLYSILEKFEEDDYEEDEDFDDEFEYLFELVKTVPDDVIEKMYIKEILKRLQGRIDNIDIEDEKVIDDRQNLIQEKYNILFSNSFLDQELLCDGFNIDNLMDYDVKSFKEYTEDEDQINSSIMIYMFNMAGEAISSIISLENTLLEPSKKRSQLKIWDIMLETSLSYLNFLELSDFEEIVLSEMKQAKMENTLAYAIIAENFREALINNASVNKRLGERAEVLRMGFFINSD